MSRSGSAASSASSSSGQLRVIAGSNRGARLAAAPGVRPTTGRVREAIFSTLGSRVVGATVLDLYAGSGALAIEALSRGARLAVLVDSDRAASAACRANLEHTALASRARVTGVEVGRFIGAAPPAEAPFSLVLCDPPYDVDDAVVASVVAGLAAPGWLESDARVVLERPRRRPGAHVTVVDPSGVAWPVGFTAVWERTYGDTLVTVLERSAPTTSP